jgi:DNA-binding CsgD family transcriptional regulator
MPRGVGPRMNESNIDRVLQSMDPIGCVLDSEGIILDVSAGWRQAADGNGLQMDNYAIGSNYLKHCISRDANSLATYRGLSNVLTGKTPFFGAVYPCHYPDSDSRWFFMAAFGFAFAADRTLILHLNLSHVLNSGSADGHVPAEPYESLIRTVRRAVREELAQLAPPSAEPVADREDRKRIAKLTERQLLLLHFLAKGYSNAQIAGELSIALSSVKSQTATLLRMLGCANRTQAALFGAKLGFDRTPSRPDYVL